MDRYPLHIYTHLGKATIKVVQSVNLSAYPTMSFDLLWFVHSPQKHHTGIKSAMYSYWKWVNELVARAAFSGL